MEHPDIQPTPLSSEEEKVALERRRTLSSWAKANLGLADKRGQKIKRWQTLPLRPKNRATMPIPGAPQSGDMSERSPFGLNVAAPSWATGHSLDYSTLPVEQKNEVDLSIAALQSVVEGLSNTIAPSARAPAANPNRLKEQVLNVIFLLQKFQVDSSVNSALREAKFRKFVSQNFVRQRGNIGNTEDREVAQWISENVFAPTELRRLVTDNLSDPRSLENAQEFYRSTNAYKRSLTSIMQANAGAAGAGNNGTGGSTNSLLNIPGSSRMQVRRSSVPPYAEGSSGSSDTAAPQPPVSGYDDMHAESGTSAGKASRVRFSEQNTEIQTVSPLPEDADDINVQKLIERIDGYLLSSSIAQCLSAVNLWIFDIFNYASLLPDSPLLVLTTHLFNTLGLFEKFSIPFQNFTNFMARIEKGYKSNAYHNAIHAADVVQNIYYFLRTASFSEKILPLDVFAALIAAAIHDVGHPGTNNAFQIAVSSDLAVTYNDRSVLENFHLAEAFRILKRPDCDIFAGLTPDMRKEIRESIIVMVLATDMQVHLHVMSELQTAIETKRESGKWFDSKNRQDTLLCLKVALHCADVANPTKPLHLYKNWVDRIVSEWYTQGDDERRGGLIVSPLMDRDKPNVARSQVGFIDFFIRPLFETWVIIVPESKECMDYLLTNRQYYETLASNPSSAASSHNVGSPNAGISPVQQRAAVAASPPTSGRGPRPNVVSPITEEEDH